MFESVIHVDGKLEIDPVKHNRKLLVVRGNGTVVLPPSDRSGGCSFGVLPRGKSKVTFRTSDNSKEIEPGNGLTAKCSISGQAITNVVFAKTWLLTVGSSELIEVPAETEQQTKEVPDPPEDDVKETDSLD